ncbi:MAG TPA: hypothetical protein VM095_03425 [Pyrinomonadaceae bacterium]|nr:hypothetical protein [Pyrinomonadaceae bacterium]
MMKKGSLLLLPLLLSCLPAFAQERFDIKDAAKDYDVRIEVAKCDNGICEGKATFTLFKKGDTRPFQTFRLTSTSFLLDEGKRPTVNKTMLYDEQSAFNFGDFNFDGTDDLALCDGTNGSYGMPSYQIYLFSPQSKKFVNSPAMTRLAQGEYLGMFEVDREGKVLRTSGKSGCCYHVTEEFTVVKNSPRKVFQVIEDATIPDEKKVKVTTRKLVNGRWRTKVKYEPRQN